MKLLFGLLSPDMDRSGFACGETALDSCLQKLAGQDMKRGFATVIVARAETAPNKIIGYYTLSAASVFLDNVSEELARKMPRYPVRWGPRQIFDTVYGYGIIRHFQRSLCLFPIMAGGCAAPHPNHKSLCPLTCAMNLFLLAIPCTLI